MMDDPMGTFFFLYECSEGGRSTALIRAMKYAIDLGGNYQQILNLLEDAMAYWANDYDNERFERTIHVQLKRHFGVE